MAITQTPRLGINNWGAGGDPFTRTQNNADHAQLELLVAIDAQGTLAARPASGVRGRYYYATDNGLLYRDTGSAWVVINPAFPTIPTIGGAAPTSSQPADTAAEGSDGRGARVDHKHGRESAGAPTSSAPGDTGSTGTGSAISLASHRHARENHDKAIHDALNIDADTLDGIDSTGFASASGLSTEVTNRTNADTTLQTNINSEASTRASADTSTLASANGHSDAGDSAEATARAAADFNLDSDKLDFTNVGGHRIGAGSPVRPIKVQSGSDTPSADAAGRFELDFPSTFPGGLICVIPSNGDDAAFDGWFRATDTSSWTTSKAYFRAINADGTTFGGGGLRVDWVAVGW